MSEYGRRGQGLLSREQEVELAKRIEQGDLDAKEELIAKNLRLALKFAGAYKVEGSRSEDIIQGSLFGLIRASEKFDWRRGLKFSTYATLWIKQSIQREIDNTKKMMRRPVTVEAFGRKVNRAERELKAKIGCDPTFDEIAEALAENVENIEMEYLERQEPASLDKPVGEDGDSSLGELVAADGADPAEQVVDQLTKEALHQSIAELPEELRTIIELIHLNGHNGDRVQVAKELQISYELLEEREAEAIGQLSKVMTGESVESAKEHWDQHRPLELQDDLAQAVFNYRKNYPDMTFKEIGQRLGISERRANNYYLELTD